MTDPGETAGLIRETMDVFVVTERDKRLAGGFDPETLEATLNSYANEGWRLVDSVLAANLMKSAKAEVLFVLERSTQP